jgi:uncharacterized membrane protein YheB (UPF0754 family)
MTTFQLVMLGLFAVVVVAAYRKELLGLLARRTRSTEQSIALTIVNDLVSVTELRDKLAAENCPEGVEACTALLRVIVEHTQKNVG